MTINKGEIIEKMEEYRKNTNQLQTLSKEEVERQPEDNIKIFLALIWKIEEETLEEHTHRTS